MLSASSQPPSTPQRKKAVINAAFEGDVSDPHSKIIANLTAVAEAKPEGTASGSSSSGPPPVVQRKLGPQKIQSTPNFFVKKQAERKVLAKSVSVPNLMKKKSSKEEKKVV